MTPESVMAMGQEAMRLALSEPSGFFSAITVSINTSRRTDKAQEAHSISKKVIQVSELFSGKLKAGGRFEIFIGTTYGV